MKTVAIVQARTGSSRLPGKVLLPLCGIPMLQHEIERIKLCKNIHEIVIATTISQADDLIVDLADKVGVKSFRGSEDDVLSRYYYAAKESRADVIVRFTADCPLIDPFVAEAVVEAYFNNECDIATNAGNDSTKRTYPRGLDTEVLSFEQLAEAHNNAILFYQREHVTPYVYENGVIYNYLNDIDYSNYRLTVDTEDDFKLIEEIYKELFQGGHDFFLSETVRLLDNNINLLNINAHIEQKKLIQSGT